jgi:hypothetical protein
MWTPAPGRPPGWGDPLSDYGTIQPYQVAFVMADGDATNCDVYSSVVTSVLNRGWWSQVTCDIPSVPPGGSISMVSHYLALSPSIEAPLYTYAVVWPSGGDMDWTNDWSPVPSFEIDVGVMSFLNACGVHVARRDRMGRSDRDQGDDWEVGSMTTLGER